MKISVQDDPLKLGEEAGKKAAELIRAAIREKGSATIILATGSSQFETVAQLTREDNVDWGTVTMFHLDEYIGLPMSHKASFRRYLKERFLDKVPDLKAVHFINGEAEPEGECQRLESLIRQSPVDVALVGIGENGHLAFNDPPADFETERAYLVADLDTACRQQQVHEGWFSEVNQVPTQAISMSVKQIMRSKHIICSTPDSRKAMAVKNTVEQQVSNLYPASILQQHPDCYLYVEKASAALLKNQGR
jgi:glucosamine-6-phosphate deaminase